jgi:hypothetical protein
MSPRGAGRQISRHESGRGGARFELRPGVKQKGALDRLVIALLAAFELSALLVVTARASVAHRCVGRIFAIPFLSLDFMRR